MERQRIRAQRGCAKCAVRNRNRRWREELGVESGDIIRLRLPDSAVTSCEDALTALVRPLVTSATLLIAPWLLDPHPDHEACGRAAQRLSACEEVMLVSYVFWAWHRTKVDTLTALPLRRFELDGPVLSGPVRGFVAPSLATPMEDRPPGFATFVTQTGSTLF